MLYIVNLAHTYMPQLCKGFFLCYCATKERVLCEEIYSFLETYCCLWGNEETQGSESVTQTSRQRQWFTVLLLLCLGSNKPVLQRGALFKFSLLPNKDGPHSLITRLWRQNKSCAHAERYAHFKMFFSFLNSLRTFFAFVPTVCWSGRSDHLYCGSVSSRPEERLSARDLHSCDVFHELSPGTRHGDKSKSVSSH